MITPNFSLVRPWLFSRWTGFGLLIIVAVCLYAWLFVAIKTDGENDRKRQDAEDRTTCSGQYETPECLQLRLKKAELKQQYEESIRSLNQSR